MPARLIYRVHRSRSKDRRNGFTEADYAQLPAPRTSSPLVVAWDNLNTHISAATKDLIAARDWLTVYQFPPYADELNPVELVWSHLKRSLASLANATSPSSLRWSRPGSSGCSAGLASSTGSWSAPGWT